MSLLDDASLIITPTAYDEDKLYAVKPINGDGDLTWTRASAATRVNSEGYIEVVAAGYPRINYPIDGGCPSVLLEPQRTNLVTYSEDFSSWSPMRVTIASNDTISPANLLNADKLTADGTSSEHRLIYTYVDTVQVAISVFAKKETHDFIQIRTNSVSSGYANYDLNLGTTTATTATSSIEDVGNGWYRCTLVTVAASILNYSINLVTSESASRSEINTLSTGVYLWGAQLEQGSYPTSYIPTNGSTATRLADIGSGSGAVDDFNSEEGVLFVEMAALADDLTNRRVSISNGTTSQRVFIGYDSTTNNIQAITSNSGTQGSMSYVVSDITDFHKIGLRYKVNDFSLWVDGVEVDTDVSGTVPAAGTINSLQLNSGAGIDSFYGKIKQIATFDYLDDTQMAALTT